MDGLGLRFVHRLRQSLDSHGPWVGVGAYDLQPGPVHLIQYAEGGQRTPGAGHRASTDHPGCTHFTCDREAPGDEDLR